LHVGLADQKTSTLAAAKEKTSTSAAATEKNPLLSHGSLLPPPRSTSQVPEDILHDPKLAAAMSRLPSNYDFEVPKTIWRLRTLKAKRVALQFPEGLLLFSLALSDIIRDFVPGLASVTVLGDVAYGACCVDDQGALACAAADALVHFGHSCLVPVQRAAIPTIYVFVHVDCDVDHLISTIALNFYAPGKGGEGGEGAGARAEGAGAARGERGEGRRRPIAIAGTVQFAPAVAAASAALAANGFRPGPVVPQSRPLSPGEVLGCTAPRLDVEEEEGEEEEGQEEEEEGEADEQEQGEGTGGGEEPPGKKSPKQPEKGGKGAPSSSSSSPTSSVAALVFVADGRFHMEALMIANPTVPAFRYDPYSRILTRERYDHGGMRRARKAAIAAAALEQSWGIVLGTLGRQGSREVLSRLVAAAKSRGKRVSVVLISELSPAKLAALTGGGGGGGGARESGGEGGGRGGEAPPFSPPRAWAQVACPRLSIDWGEGFGGLPVLTPYEAMVSLGAEKGWWVQRRRKGREGGATLPSPSAPSAAPGCCGGGEGGGRGGCGSKGETEGGSAIDLEGSPDSGHYPMDYYSAAGGSWAGTYHRASAASAASAAAKRAAAAAARRAAAAAAS